MSNTRTAKPGGPLSQQRYASSPAFERGVLANLVGPRCAVLERAQDRELVWFLQYLSHQEGGLKSLAGALTKEGRIGTTSMLKFGKRPGQKYNADQVRAVRSEFRLDERGAFMLEGEKLNDIITKADYEESSDEATEMLARSLDTYAIGEELLSAVSGRECVPDKVHRPACYFSDQFLSVCQRHCEVNLATDLERLCLDPEVSLSGGWPWYFSDLISCLRERQAAWAGLHRTEVVTEIGRLAYDVLDYALETKCLVLIDGVARIGKTFSVKAWCEARPWRARYVQVPSSSDDIGFYRAIAKALGVSTGISWKAVQLRQRIEDVLHSRDIILVLDEAHYLWPVSDCRHALPGRINWVMTALVNHGVPVALVTTPQFMVTQRVVEKRTHWTSEQFTGRIGHYLELPKSLGEEDLAKVAKALLPEGDAKSIEILVRYAQSSAKYLAGIESATRRARYLANKSGREKVERADVKRAIQEAVIPSDSALASAMAEPVKAGRRGNVTRVQPYLTPIEGAFNGPVDAQISRGNKPKSGSDLEALPASRISGGNRITVTQSEPGLVNA